MVSIPVPGVELLNPLEFPVISMIKVSFVMLMVDFWNTPKAEGWLPGQPTTWSERVERSVPPSNLRRRKRQEVELNHQRVMIYGIRPVDAASINTKEWGSESFRVSEPPPCLQTPRVRSFLIWDLTLWNHHHPAVDSYPWVFFVITSNLMSKLVSWMVWDTLANASKKGVMGTPDLYPVDQKHRYKPEVTIGVWGEHNLITPNP